MSPLHLFILLGSITYIVCDGKNIRVSRALNEIPPETHNKNDKLDHVNDTPVNVNIDPKHKEINLIIEPKHEEVNVKVDPKHEKVKVKDDLKYEPPPKPINDPKKEQTTTPKISEVGSNDQTKIKMTEMESGAVIRGVLVFVALSILFMIYIAFNMYCRKRKTPTMVSKYGVRTRRSDIEMTPLPLDEDDEDESTVFDVGRMNR